jgi:hypothetical protein
MSNRIQAMAALGLTAVLSAGCSLIPFTGGDSSRPPPPEPLLAAPSGAVTETPLPPPDGTASTQPLPTDLAALDPAQQTAGTTTPPASGTVELARTDLLGAWTVAAAGESCQLTMVLTTWTGGYRASTRGCTSTMLQGISAWNLEGNQVQLMNDTGATVARLYPSSTTQFNGQSEGGGPITVSR